MTVKQRILSIKLMEKAKEDPEYTKRLGIVMNCGEKKKKHHK